MIADLARRLRPGLSERIGGRAPTRENEDGRRWGPRNWIDGENLDGRAFPILRHRELLAWGPFLWSPYWHTPEPELAAALCLGEILANPREERPRWEPSLFCFLPRSYESIRIDPGSLSVEKDGLHGTVTVIRAERTLMARPLDARSCRGLGAPGGADPETWARHMLSLDPPDPAVKLGDDADEHVLPHLVERLECAVCGQTTFEIEVVPPFADPAGWAGWTEDERRAFDLRRWPRDYWLVCMGPGGGTGGMAIDREKAARAVEAFRGPYDHARIRAADWEQSAGVCPTCGVPYCFDHWNVSDSGVGRCPEGHVHVVDPLGH
jgi:hypothetical protein